MVQTILIMAGGTGGHVFPGLAVADHLKSAGWRVVWLGTKTGMENRWVVQHDCEIETIDFSGLRGKNVMTWMILPIRLLRALMQSLRILRRVRPDVVLGMGGYPAFPGGMMASLLNRPLIVHEQNSVPGLTNRVLAKLADRVLLGFPEAIKADKAKVTVVGNPVRAEIARLEAPEKRFAGRSGALRLLVVGGSRGAQVLNAVVPQALKLMPENHRPAVVHQAGENNLGSLRANYADLDVAAQIMEFIDDMAAHYAGCDLVLCRAGALTVAELAAAGVASILVPYPYAVDDHQTSNARFLSEHQAAVLLPQTDLSPDNLMAILRDLTREKLLAMAVAARKRAMPDATRQVAQICIQAGGVSS
ncbi:UDP-N-acetylglucosamine--N-acetylmuramyl-(pentapeptide) pyrophosphoryl-undecaprenol N-acetylglucosamine transferase [Nitrosomonas sp. Nm51]|uniref:undecaprenyldiphospho-muramoylpentapeptide beta-N-acetylglucosaminyltransferase n=1 Tax=Nitrosomonas sp. Nm51 TaxID=133720 RepID=UPI0008C0FFBB|nr:undecaprenyldiphospho-muramoylpentapeptide beta-N-acetylglucosaminyltransferase [Nitrosomonas sp. Nm51]SER30918.1 UDP-N-acetylglucosamine--N-acetylmuramyl-(pentapeptide) pyrophosphoryl-undecaprenol N-acetylglucosamine transferase [Nitrosomonas sp. Nm51]